MCVDCETKLHHHNHSPQGTCPYCRAPFPTTPVEVFAATYKHAYQHQIWAKVLLGQLYIEGQGCDVSVPEAAECFRIAAQAGSSVGKNQTVFKSQ